MAIFSDVDRRTHLLYWAGESNASDLLMAACLEIRADRFLRDVTVLCMFNMAILGFASMLISSAAVILLKTPYISQSTAGFILSFALTASNTLLSLLQVFSDLDRSMVAVERMNDGEPILHLGKIAVIKILVKTC